MLDHVGEPSSECFGQISRDTWMPETTTHVDHASMSDVVSVTFEDNKSPPNELEVSRVWKTCGILIIRVHAWLSPLLLVIIKWSSTRRKRFDRQFASSDSWCIGLLFGSTDLRWVLLVTDVLMLLPAAELLSFLWFLLFLGRFYQHLYHHSIIIVIINYYYYLFFSRFIFITFISMSYDFVETSHSNFRAVEP